MEYFKPPEFSETTSGEDLAEPVGQNFSDSDDLGSEPEKFVANILEDKSKKKKRKIDYSQFNSAEFNEVDTLLTNVEDYSKRIREDVDKYARNVRNETDLFRSEIELELANALIKRIEAEKKAREIIQNAEKVRDEILQQGHDEGYQAGFAEGIQQHKEENEKNTDAVFKLIEELKNLRKHMTQKYEEQIIQLSLLMAEKVVFKHLKSDKDLVLAMLKKTMKYFEGKGNITIRVRPEELDFIQENKSEISQFMDESQMITIRSDEKIEPASPVIESDFSVVDLSITKQFKEVEQHLKNCTEDRRALFI